MSVDTVLLEMEIAIPRDEAVALAQLLKRVGFSDVRALAKDETEAYLMMGAVSKLQDAMSLNGFDPR